MPFYGTIFIPQERIEIQSHKDRIETRNVSRSAAVAVVIAAVVYWLIWGV